MFHAYLDESGIHAGSAATAVIAVVGIPASWTKFDLEWPSFVQGVGVSVWHHRDFCNRRKGYGSLTDSQWLEARDKLCQLLIDAQFFIAGAAIGRQTYERVRADGKWRLPNDPYKFCLEQCLKQVTKKIYRSNRDDGVRIYYDAAKQHGGIARELLRWHKETFEANYLSQYRDRIIEIEFGDGGIKSARAVPDIIAFEACEYVRADTGIPFLGAKPPHLGEPCGNERSAVNSGGEKSRARRHAHGREALWALGAELRRRCNPRRRTPLYRRRHLELGCADACRQIQAREMKGKGLSRPFLISGLTQARHEPMEAWRVSSKCLNIRAPPA
jgi:hypothetical protein